MENLRSLVELQCELSSRYELTLEEVVLGHQQVSLLKVADMNRLLDRIDSSAFSIDERLPFWAELWPSSIELARYCLLDNGLESAAVLELGSGLGLAGIAAAMAGGHIIFSDYESDALMFARYNALKNLLPDALLRVQFQLLDWRSALLPQQVDLIMGADIVYERRNFLPILRVVQRNLKRNGRAIFTDPDRATGMAFFALAEREGFDVSVEPRLLNVGGRAKTILFGQLRRP
jgi:predicted nicotinamide N-methyase